MGDWTIWGGCLLALIGGLAAAWYNWRLVACGWLVWGAGLFVATRGQAGADLDAAPAAELAVLILYVLAGSLLAVLVLRVFNVWLNGASAGTYRPRVKPFTFVWGRGRYRRASRRARSAYAQAPRRAAA